MSTLRNLVVFSLSVSILVLCFGSVAFCWQPPNPVMDPNMAVMGPPMQPGPVGPPVQPPPFGAPCPPPMGMMPCQPGVPGCKPGLLGPLTLSAGYVSTFNGSGYRREFSQNNLGGTQPNLEFRVPATGAWLGASQTFYVGRSCGLLASGGILIPSKTTGDLVEQGQVIIPVNSEFSASNNWGRIDGAGFCEVFRSANCSFSALAIGGFRWDYYSSKQDGSSTEVGTGVLVENFKNDLTINSYLPYIGGQLSQNFGDFSANVRFIVSPGLWGNMKLQETDVDFTGAPLQGGGETSAPVSSGTFLELYSVLTARLMPQAEVGAYFDWTKVELVSDSRNNVFTFNGLPTVSTPEQIRFDRNTWSVGGTALINFDLGL
ncbi:MAG TPA: hypothetical protein VK463_18455 [Desulfomonilaceae bacterium]|nr:hypothetical protein [Desulfomonilaceae bacterium]